MPEAAVVVTSYRIPTKRLTDWLAWNSEYFQWLAGVYLVCDEDTAEWAKQADWRMPLVVLPYPVPLQQFSITRTANYGIRRAMEDGCRKIIKTDVDVVFLSGLGEMLEVDNRKAITPRYGDAASYETRNQFRRYMPHGQGTISMTAHNWERLEGYDERCSGWGFDDNEMCQRIAEAGIEIDDAPVVAHIDHGLPKGADWNADSFNPNLRAINVKLIPRGPRSQPHWGIPR